jgi:hypothetical protein
MDKAEAYSLLSDLIFKGFLTAEFSVNGQAMILKTVNEKEFDLIKFYSGDPDGKNHQNRFNIYFLIFSLFIVDHRNVLPGRNEKIHELYEYFGGMTDKLIKKMIESLNTIRLSSYDCLKYLEGFTYNTRSTWRVLAKDLPTKVEFTGIPGTDELGLSIHQENWISINRSLDYEEDYNKDFSLSLLVASASNPKGSRHVRNQFDSSKKMAEDRRKKIMKEGFIDTRKWSPEGWAAPVDTAEELVAELERQMTGVKDRHDIFMEKYMERMRETAAKKAREAEERIKQLREGRDDVLIDGSQRAMTAEEVRKLTAKPLATVELVPEQIITEEDRNKYYKKIGARVLTGR